MESGDHESETSVPRFLDELELVERKRIRLDSHGKQRWSLTDRKEDNQVLAEMGVALLDDSHSPIDELSSKIHEEDIENQSPNLRVVGTRNPSSSKRPASLGTSANKRLKKSHDENSLLGPIYSSSNIQLSSPQPTCGPHPALHCPPTCLPRHTTFDDDNASESNTLHIESKSLHQTNSEELNEHSLQNKIFDSEANRTILTDDNDGYYYKSEDDNHSSDLINDSDGEITSKRFGDCSSRFYDKSSHPQDTTGICDTNRHNSNSSRLSHDDNCSRLEEESKRTEDISKPERECFTALNKSFCGSCDDSEKCLEHSALVHGDNEDGGTFCKLSDEVVLSILQWLPKRILLRCMLVCRRWRRLGADGRLWARVDLGGRVLPSGALSTLMTRHPVALRLANAQLTSPVIPEPVMRDWRVQYLDMSAASISPDCLASILRTSPGLIRLSLEGVFLGKCAAEALGKLRHLRALNLTLTTGLGVSGCQALGALCKLENLNIAWAGLDAAALDVLCNVIPVTLQRLNLAGCRRTMSDSMVDRIITRCSGLVELDLSDSPLLTGDSIPHLVRLPKLEHLALSRCYGLQPDDYVQLSMCPSLQWLDVFGLLPFVNLSEIQKGLPHLQFNKFINSSVARPTVGNRRTSIWGLRTRD